MKNTKKLIIFVLFTIFAFTSVYHFSQKQRPHVSMPIEQYPLLGSKHAEICDAILGENRNKQELIVMEQDLNVTSKIDDTFLGWGVFKKAQDITMYGSAVYTTDLSKMDDGAIIFNDEKNEIIVMAPQAKLKHVAVDFEKTTFSEIDRGLLGWGNLSLTPEEQSAVEQSLTKKMESEANKEELLKKADEAEIKALTSIYGNLIKEIEGVDATLRIELIR